MNKKSLIIGGGLLLAVITAVLIYIIVMNITPAPEASAVAVVSAQPKTISGKEGAALKDAAAQAFQGDDSAAISNINKILERDPQSQQAETALFLLGSIYEKQNDLLKAKDAYQKIIEKFPSSNNLMRAQEAIDNLNVKMLFSSQASPNSFMYEVVKGDTLTKIAKKFGTTVELIERSNNLKNGNIKFGKKLKITKYKFSIIVDKSQNILTLKADGDVFKTYRVSTGKPSSDTPAGTYKVINKIVNPPWYPSAGGVIKSGDPKNVLGTRWLGLSKEGYGIHGTVEPESIGKSVTEGCIRLKNSEVEELYAMVPEGAEVLIVD